VRREDGTRLTQRSVDDETGMWQLGARQRRRAGGSPHRPASHAPSDRELAVGAVAQKDGLAGGADEDAAAGHPVYLHHVAVVAQRDDAVGTVCDAEGLPARPRHKCGRVRYARTLVHPSQHCQSARRRGEQALKQSTQEPLQAPIRKRAESRPEPRRGDGSTTCGADDSDAVM
jgi:hypothetical protein